MALLIDTYNTIEGARVAANLGISPTLVRLDSGDLLDLSVKVRRILDTAGHNKTKIFASGDLNEYKIQELITKGAPIDSFGVGTELTTSREDPALPGIYKLVELQRGSQIIPRVKLSPAKVTIPELKQIHRAYDSSGLIKEDIVAIDEETFPDLVASPLLTKVIKRGRLVYRVPPLAQTRDYCKSQMESLPQEFKNPGAVTEAPVKLSPRLSALCEELYHGIA